MNKPHPTHFGIVAGNQIINKIKMLIIWGENPSYRLMFYFVLEDLE
jgi:hypothetical protein